LSISRERIIRFSFQPSDNTRLNDYRGEETGTNTDEHSSTQTAKSAPNRKYQRAKGQHGGNTG